MDTYNQPTILELRYDLDSTDQYCVFTGKSFRFSAEIPINIATQMLDIVETQNYIGAITYGIRTPEITYMSLDIETMLLEDGEQYPDTSGIIERVKRALGNLQFPDKLTIEHKETYVHVVINKLGD